MTITDVLKDAFVSLGMSEDMALRAAKGRGNEPDIPDGKKWFTAYDPLGEPLAILEADSKNDAELWALRNGLRNPGKFPGFFGYLSETDDYSGGLPFYKVPVQELRVFQGDKRVGEDTRLVEVELNEVTPQPDFSRLPKPSQLYRRDA